MGFGALGFAAHEQFAVEHALGREGRGDVGKAARNIVPGAAVEPRVAAGMDQLDADPVPFPFGGIIVEADLRVLDRVGEHERAEHRDVGDQRRLGAALAPVEQFGEGRLEPVPHLLDPLDVEPEGVGQRLLGEPRRNADAQRAGGELEDGVAPRRVEMVEHFLEHARGVGAARGGQSLDRVGQAHAAIVEVGLAVGRGPQQRHGLGHVADIVAAHLEQDGVDALLGERADHRRLDRGNVERAGQRGERQPAVGIGGVLEISADQPQLAVARAGVDEVVEELAEGAHGHDNA